MTEKSSKKGWQLRKVTKSTLWCVAYIATQMLDNIKGVYTAHKQHYLNLLGRFFKTFWECGNNINCNNIGI